MYILPISKSFFEKDIEIKEEIIDCIDEQLSISCECTNLKEQKSYSKLNLKVNKKIFNIWKEKNPCKSFIYEEKKFE